METSLLRQLLKNLCTNYPWSYAVFWKLQQQNHMLLTYEDGYYDYPRLQETCQSIFSDAYSRQEDISDFVFETNLLGRSSMGYPIRSAITDMSRCQYELGEGLVGRVAVSGNDHWIYSDDIGSTEFMSNNKYHDEWLLPAMAGIKTTLLAPILPHGVVQLGSLEKVAESWALVADIKNQLTTIQSTTFTVSFDTGEDPLVFSSSLLPELDRDESSFASNTIYKIMESEGSEEVHTADIAEDEFSNVDQVMHPPFAAGKFLQPEDVPAISPFMDDQDISYLYLNHDIESNALARFAIAAIPEMKENVWQFSCQEERDYNGVLGESSISTYLLQDDLQQLPTDENDGETSPANVGKYGGFPRDCELHKVLESAFQTKNHSHSQSSYNTNLYFCADTDSLVTEPSRFSDTRGDQEHLLEAVVTSISNNSDDTTSYRCNSSRSSLTSLEETTSFQVEISCEGNAALSMDDTTSVRGECTMFSWDPCMFSLTSPPSIESLATAIMEDEQPLDYGYGLPTKSTKVPKRSRSKARPKSNHRQRPRDRQLIQDRLNELRGLVPNTEKCSIDGLLDQAIKHLMFLKSVTDQAEKVKQFTKQELNAEIKSTSQALEEEENHGSCPIIVRDLEHPGQILIQMLCNNDQVFFEMAEVIHQLKLTILKGVMETRSNNWAHFIVQTSMGFNRLDIFWPLMRILQRNGNWKMNQWCP